MSITFGGRKSISLNLPSLPAIGSQPPPSHLSIGSTGGGGGVSGSTVPQYSPKDNASVMGTVDSDGYSRNGGGAGAVGTSGNGGGGGEKGGGGGGNLKGGGGSGGGKSFLPLLKGSKSAGGAKMGAAVAGGGKNGAGTGGNGKGGTQATVLPGEKIG
jgi:hypothetical protein